MIKTTRFLKKKKCYFVQGNIARCAGSTRKEQEIKKSQIGAVLMTTNLVPAR
jgi:hypothetical protein